MSEIVFEELKKLPYLDMSALDDRTVKLMPLWDGTDWHMWFDTPVGLIKGKIVDTAEGDYVAKSAARPSDLFIPFVHIMWQQASWREICPLIMAISEDFHNMGTSVDPEHEENENENDEPAHLRDGNRHAKVRHAELLRCRHLQPGQSV
jgi:hypothetical protein